MFQSIVLFDVRPGMEGEFERAFHACGMLTRPRSIEGFVSADLMRAADGVSGYVVVGQWKSQESYSQWQAVAQSGAPREELRRLGACLQDPRPGRLYRMV